MIWGKTKLPADGVVRILVVDDECGPRLVLKTALTEKGFEVQCAEGGERALELFQVGKFDLLLVDLIMPDMNGIELIRRVQAISPETLIVLITGYASLDSAIEAVRAGAYDYLTKPFQLQELYVVVKNAVDRINLIRENKQLLNKLGSLYQDSRKDTPEKEPGLEDCSKNFELLQTLQSHLLKIYSRPNNEN